MLEETPAKSTALARTALSERQIEVLQVLYKFRFATAQLINAYQHQNTWASNTRLQQLVEQEYLGRNFDASYHLNHLAATYFLLPKGIRFLRKHTEVDAGGLRLSYNSRKAKADLIVHCLRVFRIYLKLDDLFLDDMEFYSNPELAGQSIFPISRPDAYLRFTGTHAALPHCMLELIERSSSKNKVRREILRFLDHYDSGSGWGEAYPNVLLVCDDPELEVFAGQCITRELVGRGLPRPKYYTTTNRALHGPTQGADSIWRDVRNAAGPKVSLKSMSQR